MADLGDRINVMAYTMITKLGLSDLRSTRMILELMDRSIRHPREIIEDVLVWVENFIFPVDFVIVDVDEDVEVPFIL